MESSKGVRDIGDIDHNSGEIFALRTRLGLPEKELIDLQAKFTLEHYNLFAISLKGSSDLILLCDGRHPSSFTNLLPVLEKKILGNCGTGSWTLKHIPWFEDSNKKISALSFDEDGTLYIGLLNGTIYELNAMMLVSTSANSNENEVDLHHVFQFDDLQILDILIWFKGNSKIILCDGGNGKFLLLPTNSLPTLVTFNSPIRSIELYIGATKLACALICLENGQNVTTVLDDLDLPPMGDNLVKKSIFRRAKENIISRFGDSEKGHFFARKPNKEISGSPAIAASESLVPPQDTSDNVVSLVTKFAPPTNIKVTHLEELCRGELRKIVGKNQFFRHKENKLDIFDNDFRQTSSVYIPSYITKLYIVHKIFFGIDEENKCLRISLVHNAMLKEFAIIPVPPKILFIEPTGDSETSPYSIFVTTQSEVYQLCIRKSPLDICVDLLTKETVSVLLDVVCLALNVSKLDAYVAAGDKCSQEGKYAKTIIYYKLAGMNHPKIIAKFGSRGLIPAMIYFSELVEEEKHRYVGSLKEKSFMANIVILGKVEQFVRHGERTNLVTDPKVHLKNYLTNNLYYNSRLVAMSLCYPELLWALDVVGETRLCYPDILVGLYNNREKLEDCTNRKVFWQIVGCDWMALFAAPGEVFAWFRSLVLKQLHIFDDDVLRDLIVSLLPWRREVQQKLFRENLDLDEIIDFTLSHETRKVAINDYVELFLTLLVEAVGRNIVPPLKIPTFLRKKNILKVRKGSQDSTNNIAQILIHLSFKTTLSASLSECACIRNEKLYTWGESRLGRLGIREEQKPKIYIDTPTPISLISQLNIGIQSVSCGQAHNMALTDAGTILVWGSNTPFGQLGIGPQITWTGRPTALENPNVTFSCIAAGGYHSVAVDNQNIVWSWGWGVYGQLGNSSIENRMYPGKIFIDAKYGKPIMVSAGHSHTAILTNTGKVLTFGCAHFGQLGHGSTMKVKTPKLLEGLPSGAIVKFINCGISGTALVTMRNRLFYCGLNPSTLKSLLNSSRRSGKPPEGVEEKDFLSPTLIESIHLTGDISKVSVGTTHLAVLTTAGYIYTFGMGKSGQLIRPDDENKTLELIDCDDKMIVASDVVCAGDCTLFIEKDSGRIFGCGFNSCGQLGKMEGDEEASIMTIRTKKRIVKVRQPANIYFRPREISGLPRQYLDENHGKRVSFPDVSPPTNIIGQELLEWCLKILLKKYNHSHIKKFCIKVGNNKAAAEIDKLHEQYESALKNELADAKNSLDSGKIISNYAEDAEARKSVCLPQMCTFLTIVINHWMRKDLPGDELECVLEIYRRRPLWKVGLSFAVKETMTLNENSGNESAEWMAANLSPVFILNCFKDGEKVPSYLIPSKINLLEPETFSEDELDEIDLIDT